MYKRVGLLGIMFVIVLVSGCGKEKPANYGKPNGFTGNWLGCWGWATAESDTIPLGTVWADLVGQGKTISGTATLFSFGLFDTPHYQVGQVSGSSENGVDFTMVIIQEDEDTLTCVGTLSGNKIQGTYSYGTGGGNYTLKKGIRRIWQGKADGQTIYDSLHTADTTYMSEVSLSIAFTETGWGDSVLMGGNASFWGKKDTFALNIPAEGKIVSTDTVAFYFPGTIRDSLGHHQYSLFIFSGYLEGSSDSVVGEWHTRRIGPTTPFGLWANGVWKGKRNP